MDVGSRGCSGDVEVLLGVCVPEISLVPEVPFGSQRVPSVVMAFYKSCADVLY